MRDPESKFDGFLCYECEEFEVNMRPHPNIGLMAPFEIKFKDTCQLQRALQNL